MLSLPESVTIGEVGPRDGLQIEREFVPTEKKVRLINALIATGLRKIEVSSFVHPKVVPQLQDAEEVFASIDRPPGIKYAAFIPNVKGAERAMRCGVNELKTGAAASETFNQLNVRMSTEDSLRNVKEIAEAAKGTDCEVIGGIGTAFGCPYEGVIPEQRVLSIIEHYIQLGVSAIHLADTTGMANPWQIQRLVGRIKSQWPKVHMILHLHNTRGAGLANALAGLDAGVTEFEGSIGGLGGCPFAPRAVGNICTEDFVHMLHEMGIRTGVDLDGLLDAAKLAEQILGRTLPGMVMKAGKTCELHDPSTMRH